MVKGAAVRIVRKPIVGPDWRAISSETQDLLALAADKLGQVDANACANVAALDDAHFDVFKHPLSEKFVSTHGLAKSPNRTALEVAVLEQFELLASPDWLTNDTSFVETVIAVNAALVGDTSGLHHGQAVFRTDENIVVFPKYDHPEIELTMLRRFFTGHDNAVFRASIFFAHLTNRHLFHDGNGRTARLFFNAHLLHHGLTPQVYVPLSEISERSKGGFQLWLREGEIFGQWDGWLRLIAKSIMLLAKQDRVKIKHG